MAARQIDAGFLAAAAAAVCCFLLALRLRSWPLWLVAFALAIVALGVAWYAREVSPS